MRRLRIFVASPSDTAPERAQVGSVVRRLQPLADNNGLTIEVLDWGRVVPGVGRPEQVILDQLNPTSWDVFIGILWHRFGTPPAGRDARTRAEYLSGTEEEFMTAYRLWEQHRKPRIMMYWCKRPAPLDDLDPEQLRLVKEFFSRFDAIKGAHPGLYQTFDTTESFDELLFNGLQILLLQYGEAAGVRPPPAMDVHAPRLPDNLPRRAPFFGRDAYLETALRALDPEDRTWGILLDGIGGIGKTSLAVEAAYRSREKGLFESFVYISAKINSLHPAGVRDLPPAAQTLDDFLDETARLLGEAGLAGLPANKKRRALIDALRRRPTLLIYDNLETLPREEQEQLADFLRDLPQGSKAIITSRRRGDETAVWLRVEKLEWVAAQAIIVNEMGRAPQLATKMRKVGKKRWRELYDATKGSPLALVHTLGLLRVRATLTFDAALALLRDSQDPNLQKFVFQEARRELDQNDEAVLRALSFFDSHATLGALTYVAGLSYDVLTSSLNRLVALSLVDWRGGERYALHPLTRDFVRDELLKDIRVAAELERRFTRYWDEYAQASKVPRQTPEADKAPKQTPEARPSPPAEAKSSPPAEVKSSPTAAAGSGLAVEGPPDKVLERLSWNYWWSWAADGPGVFRELDPELWEEAEHNPRRLLSEVSEYRLAQMSSDPSYVARVGRLAAEFNDYMSAAGTLGAGALTPARPVAYFCAEYGVHKSLPLYAGGLGILAGDHLKSASDLNVPLVAVGLFYKHGYFRQRVRRDGWQEETYMEMVPEDLPLSKVRSEDGDPLLIELTIRGRLVRAQVWRAEVGRVSLYLLDTDVEGNELIDRLITAHLYGGDRETRCVQEIVLGVGGVRLLQRLGVEPHVFHLNEGHSAFLTLELARGLTRGGAGFAEAAARVRERCVFTTHTPVAAGHDEFVAALIERCFGEGYWQDLGLSREEFLDLGRLQAGDEAELFSLTPLALRMCRAANGVSRKHGEVTRDLWHKMWPGRAVEDVPITSITNGVHAPTWVSPLLASLYERRVGRNWAEVLRDPEAWAQAVEAIPDEELWEVRRLMKRRLIAFVRERLFQTRLTQGEASDYAAAAYRMFDPDALTIGFARRVAAYKRWSLILTDHERLRRLITDAERPVQLIFAGKAHPQDQGAKVILQQLSLWKLDPEIMQRAVFIQDYDQEIARGMVQAIDVWLSAPRPPLEASGTSGQKVIINGGLNLSTLDGWWPEGYDGTNGWVFGDADDESAAAEDADRRDAESLYRVLETEVVPTFYERDEYGLPRRWLTMMRRAIQTLAPRFNSDRMVREYAERVYSPPPDDDFGGY